MNIETIAADLDLLADEGVGFDLNPTMMATSIDELWGQYQSYLTRVDAAWRRELRARASALRNAAFDA